MLMAQEQRVGQLSKQQAISQNEAVTTIAELRVRLLERKSSAVASGSETIKKLNQDLIQLSIDRREIEARMKVIRLRLDKLNQSIEIQHKITELAEVQEQASRARSGYIGLRSELERNPDPGLEVSVFGIEH